ncbi:hypothetical protein ANCCAN_25497 [Ancylostoma caninum]|uniref:Uncharacterized protein n=1 Tax=Ancylostoma caninum TaxID=29170 RepID=A0A368F9D2_ANCCA|nr:hypothetical protein ANCCAN_25497 [Ancylostoma caninum]
MDIRLQLERHHNHFLFGSPCPPLCYGYLILNVKRDVTFKQSGGATITITYH